MAKTRIEWTKYSWNPVTGCSPCSEGCEHCYAQRMAKRLAGRFGYPKDNPFAVTVHHDRFCEPLEMHKPTIIFTCSMGDLFHDEVRTDTIFRVFDVMRRAKWHQFIVLTKRPHRVPHFCQAYLGHPSMEDPHKVWPDNVIAMTTVENQDRAYERIPHLLRIPAKLRGLSIEPMLGPIDISYFLGLRNTEVHKHAHIDLVIVGGETGPGARPMHPDWVRKIRDNCQSSGVSFFFKSWGDWVTVYDRDKDDPDWRKCPEAKNNNERYLNLAGGHGFHGDRVLFVRKVGKKKAGRLLDGREWNEWPGDNHENL